MHVHSLLLKQTLQLSFVVCVCIFLSRASMCVCVLASQSERVSDLFFFFLCMKIIWSHVSWTGTTSLFFAKHHPWELKHKPAHPTKIPAGIVFFKGERTPLRKTKTLNANDACKDCAVIFHRPAQEGTNQWTSCQSRCIDLMTRQCRGHYWPEIIHSLCESLTIGSKKAGWRNAVHLLLLVGLIRLVQRLNLSLPLAFSFIPIRSFLKLGPTIFLFNLAWLTSAAKLGAHKKNPNCDKQ